MNLSETARLLGAMAAFDRRTVGDGDVIAWQAVLSDAPFDDCLEAVKRHYAEHTEWMMPAHVRRLVRDVVRERETAARDTGWAPGQYGVPREDAAPEVAAVGRLSLSDLPAAVAEVIARVRTDLPEGSREALMPRRVEWERKHRGFVRQRRAEPNPHYRPNPHAAPLADDSGGWCAPASTAVPGSLYDPMPDRDDPALQDWLKARGWPSYEDWARRGETPHGWLTCALCGGDVRDLPGHVAEYHPDAPRQEHQHHASCHGEAGELLCGGHECLIKDGRCLAPGHVDW